MKYQNILFSRSKIEDYRWILTPSFLKPNDLEKLERFVWSDDTRGYLGNLKLFFPFCVVRLSESIVLARFSRTPYFDSKNRPIDCIDGIAVPLSELWFFRFSLSWLLTDYVSILDSWESLDFNNADRYLKKDPGFLEFDFKYLNSNPTNLNNESKEITGNYSNNKSFSFDHIGYLNLVNFLFPSSGKSKLDLLQIAFGVPTSKAPLYKGFEVLSYINSGEVSSVHKLPGTESVIRNTSEATERKVSTSSSIPESGGLPSSRDFDKRVQELRGNNTANENNPEQRSKSSLLKRLLGPSSHSDRK